MFVNKKINISMFVNKNIDIETLLGNQYLFLVIDDVS